MKKFLFFVILFSIVSCAPKKLSTKQKTKTEPKPSWISKNPTDGEYYYGIGTATLSEDSSHIINARAKAINDLAKNIDITISDNSILAQFEDQPLEYVSHHNLKKLNHETVFENEVEYWVMYDINKQEWLQIRKEQKQATLKKAHQHYNTAISATNFKIRFIELAKALDQLQPYWNESCVLATDNDSIVIDNLIITALSSLANSIIVSEQTPLWLNLDNNYNTTASFKAICPIQGNITPIIDVPFQVVFNTSQQSILSEQKGLIKQQIQVTNFNEQEGLIEIKPEFEKLLNELVSAQTRLLLSQLKTPSFVFEWQLEPPLLFFETTTAAITYLPHLKKILLNNAFSIATNKQEADLLFYGQVESWIIKESPTSTAYHTSLVLLGKNKNDKIMFSHTFEEAIGVHTNQEQARSLSIEQLKRQVENWDVQSFFDVIFLKPINNN